MKPWTPTNGRVGFPSIGGTGSTTKLTPASTKPSRFQGPVIANGVWPFANCSFMMSCDTEPETRPSATHFSHNSAAASPPSESSPTSSGLSEPSAFVAEHVAAAARVHRVVVVRVGGRGLLDRQRCLDRAVTLQLEGHRLEVLERGRRLRHEIGVAEQRDVLDRVRQPVRLALVRERLDGDVLVLVRHLAQVERRHDAALDEVAERVVGVREEVGTGATGRGLEDRVVEIAVGDLLHGDVGALHRGAVVHDRLDHRGAGLVRPDDEIGIAGSGRHRRGRRHLPRRRRGVRAVPSAAVPSAAVVAAGAEASADGAVAPEASVAAPSSSSSSSPHEASTSAPAAPTANAES